VIGSAQEASNVDIADEFSKLIVTQQAYTAGTRIVTTADQLISETLNMKR
jgi:flagellar hook protein FlgE